MYKIGRFYCFKSRTVSLLHPSGTLPFSSLLFSSLISTTHAVTHICTIALLTPYRQRRRMKWDVRMREEEGWTSNLWQAGRLSFSPCDPAPLHFAIFPTCFNKASFLSWYPICQPPSFLFQAMCMALPMPHPPFSLHAVSLYPWQPMISFSPELGARPQARRGVFACVIITWRERERGRRGGFNVYFYIPLVLLTAHSSQMSAAFVQQLCQLNKHIQRVVKNCFWS